jgi:hypothetical protein
LEPRFGTPMSLAKFKQNSSDMNEIILAPCDAGYVQSCTGLIWTITHFNKLVDFGKCIADNIRFLAKRAYFFRVKNAL